MAYDLNNELQMMQRVEPRTKSKTFCLSRAEQFRCSVVGWFNPDNGIYKIGMKRCVFWQKMAELAIES